MGIYFEETSIEDLPAAKLAGELLDCGSPEVERFCDNDGDYQRKYNVYRLTADGKRCVLKKSDKKEAALYRDFLQDKCFAVPEYYGTIEDGGKIWLLIEYIDGPDMRRFDREMACACAETLAQIQNAYWDCKIDDGRFQRYWERVNRRARCLDKEPELAAVYALFLERQKSCPRTLSNGDFLQCNAIFREGRAYMVDWAFGGIMPYALDAARLIAHGLEKPEPFAFPFYMDDDLRRAFLHAHYERLDHKPDWQQYLTDIKLAALNEYVEFFEVDLNAPDVTPEEARESADYRHALETARVVLQRGAQE